MPSGIMYRRNPDEQDGQIHLWDILDQGEEVETKCGEFTYSVVQNRGVQFDTETRDLLVSQKESFSGELTAYCDECVEKCDKI